MKDNTKILKFHLIHFLVFFIVTFVYFINTDRIDAGFGMLIYTPMMFFLVCYNLIVILISNGALELFGLLEKSYFRLISFTIPIITILILYFTGNIINTIALLSVGYNFWFFIALWLILNLILFILVHKANIKMIKEDRIV